MRRIVTGHDDNGLARALLDGAPPNVRRAGSGVVSTLMWCTDKSPSDISTGAGIEDMGDRQLGTAPPPGGTRFSVVDFPPGNAPHLHRTESLDYAIVLAGKIEMRMDDSTLSLRAGDIVIQRGTNHAWINRADEVARVAFILIDAVPLGLGHAVAGKETAS